MNFLEMFNQFQNFVSLKWENFKKKYRDWFCLEEICQ